MRKLLTIICFYALFVWPVFAQNARTGSNPSSGKAAPEQQKPTEQKPVEMLDHWRRSTISLGLVVQENGSTKFVTLGSAVIVALDGHRACLLTAKHMVQDPQSGMPFPALWMRFPALDGKDETPIPLALFDNQHRNTWVASDDSDLVVLPLPRAAWTHPNPHAVGIQDFANPEIDLFQGAAAMVLGYPGIIGEQFLTAPIARGGMIAWVDPSDPAGKPFLVDANLYNGNSGGPVFRLRNGFDRYGNMNIGGGFAFIGIVSKGPLQQAPVISEQGYVYHVNPVTGRPSQEVAVVKNVGGIGIVEPVARVRKLLEKVYGKQ